MTTPDPHRTAVFVDMAHLRRVIAADHLHWADPDGYIGRHMHSLTGGEPPLYGGRVFVIRSPLADDPRYSVLMMFVDSLDLSWVVIGERHGYDDPVTAHADAARVGALADMLPATYHVDDADRIARLCGVKSDPVSL